MATEEIDYRIDVQRANGEWESWCCPDDLAAAKAYQLNILGLPTDVITDARIVELRTVRTETVVGVDAASLDILSREEI